MPRARKPAHVYPDLRYEGFGGPTIDAGDGAKERHLLLAERGDHPLDLFAKARYGLVQVVDVGHYLAHHEGMIWEEKHPSRASRSAGGPGTTPPAPPDRWARRPAHLRRSSSGSTKHAGGHTRELYPGILEHLLKTLDLPCALLDS